MGKNGTTIRSSRGPKHCSVYIQQLEQRRSIEVQGYQRSTGLWRDSFTSTWPLPWEIQACRSSFSRAKLTRVGDFDHFICVLGMAGRRSWIVVKVLACANHSFASRQG